MKKTSSLIVLALTLLLLFACASGSGNTSQVSQPDVPEVTAPPSDTPDMPEELPPAESPAPPEVPDEKQSDDTGTDVPVFATGEVIISFEYTKQSGPASNQHAVWIEDMDGRLVKTLFASRWTAEGGFATRPDSIALWAQRAGLANMSSSEIDAFSGATPRTGAQSYIWDLTDQNGAVVMQGDYMFFVEGTLRWKNFVLYSGIINIGNESVTVQAETVFHYEATDRYEALTADSIENNMIGSVTAEFIP